jgi:hypothetical protein
LATGGDNTVIVVELAAAGHGPAGSSVLKVKVTLPLVIAGVYVVLAEVTLPNVPPDDELQLTEDAAPP